MNDKELTLVLVLVRLSDVSLQNCTFVQDLCTCTRTCKVDLVNSILWNPCWLHIIYCILFLYSVFSISTVMVVYRHDSDVMAAGHLEQNRREIHGKRVPTDHVCVLLTTSKSNVTAHLLLTIQWKLLFWRKESFLLFLNNSHTEQVFWMDHSRFRKSSFSYMKVDIQKKECWVFIHQLYIWTQSIIFLTKSFTEKSDFRRISTTFKGNLTQIKITERKIERVCNQHLWVGWMFCNRPGICKCERNQNKH